VHQDAELEVLPSVQFLEDLRIRGPDIAVGRVVDEAFLGPGGGAASRQTVVRGDVS
jgi:hypothetical protein